jgi:predicted metal-binding transcription factor (methanogenesis marker protein 9)
MTDEYTQQQKNLCNYLIRSGFSNLDSSEVQRLVAGMTAQDITECLEYARRHLDQLKTTPLGRELV